ncbi:MULTISPECIES: hypothetical protein [Vallitalea]|uniref:Uncharacterized protein n=2 Tax=Vallitalea TaxID=1348611 RepID=A0A8J8MEW7_9FIRM|nr:hypothetical protein [Vallitalea guaymasensis]QUH31651.1 hypothetical protein HYG85_23070 [Vallitalea guaymasensis]GMQ64879.1 hypothetical protein AN2V17_41190 [Vallitalea sp. AN17-2]
MKKKNVRRRNNRYNSRNRKKEDTYSSKLAIKIFISFVILLSTLYLKKYEIKIGEFDVNSIYEVLYYNEDFAELSNKVLKIGDETAVKDFLN